MFRVLCCLAVVVLGFSGCWKKPLKIDVSSGRISKNRVGISDSEFYWHNDVRRRAELFSLELKGVNLLENLRETKSLSRLKEFRSFHRIGHLCVRTIARAYSGTSIADFWVFVTFGHSGDSRPTFERERLSISVTGGNVILLDSPATGGLPVAHGQGLPIKHFRFNCTSGLQESTELFADLDAAKRSSLLPFFTELPRPPWWIRDPDLACAKIAADENRHYPPFEQSKYVPAFPGMSGKQQQFGVYMLLPELTSNGYRLGSWRSQLYQEGCRPCHFLHPDGSRVTEDDYPETVLTSSGWIHERSRGSYWIKHTHPSSHWKDKGARTSSGTAWSFYDAQHWAVNALCQATFYDDPGLDMLVEDLAEGWLWANPVTDCGTTHHTVPKSARARGRVLESGCSIAFALEGDVRERVTARVEALLQIQIDEFKRCIAANESPLVSRKDGLSVWEHGLWVKGLFATLNLLPHRRDEIHAMGSVVCDWILDGFKDFGGRWYVPYVIQPNGSWTGSACKELSTWCLPAIQLIDRFDRPRLSVARGRKITEILDQFANDPAPPKLGWPDLSKWWLF